MTIIFEAAVERLKQTQIRTQFAAFLASLDAETPRDRGIVQEQLEIFFSDLIPFLSEVESIYKTAELCMLEDKREADQAKEACKNAEV